MIKFLFIGSSNTLMIFKATFWLLATLITVSLIEFGGNDGELHGMSILVLTVGGLFTVISLLGSLFDENRRERLAADRIAKLKAQGNDLG